jgi:6-phosphogluconolactonase
MDRPARGSHSFVAKQPTWIAHLSTNQRPISVNRLPGSEHGSCPAITHRERNQMHRKLHIKYYVEPDPAALAQRAAQYFSEMVSESVADQNRARIAISGGSTPKAAFHLLADPDQPWRARMPWDKLSLYWVDERTVPPDHPDSNYRMTREAMLDHVPVHWDQVHRMEGELDPEVAASRYESKLRDSFRLEGAESPRFDLISLGMGPDGHTASLFPNTEAIHEMTRLVTSNNVPQLCTRRITLTWPVINHARSVFFLIAGADKADRVREVFMGPRDPERLPSQLIWPSSGILTLFLDKAAAAHLPATDGEGSGVLERQR